MRAVEAFVQGLPASISKRLGYLTRRHSREFERFLDAASNEEKEDLTAAIKDGFFDNKKSLHKIIQYPAMSTNRIIELIYEDIASTQIEKESPTPIVEGKKVTPDEDIIAFINSNMDFAVEIPAGTQYVAYCANHRNIRPRLEQRKKNVTTIIHMLGHEVAHEYCDMDPNERSVDFGEYRKTVIVVSTWKDIAHPGLAERVNQFDVLIADEIEGPLLKPRPDGTLDNSPAAEKIADVRFRLQKYIEQPENQNNPHNDEISAQAKERYDLLMQDILTIMSEKHVISQKAIVNELKEIEQYVDLSHVAIQGRVTRVLKRKGNKDLFKQKKREIKEAAANASSS